MAEIAVLAVASHKREKRLAELAPEALAWEGKPLLPQLWQQIATVERDSLIQGGEQIDWGLEDLAGGWESGDELTKLLHIDTAAGRSKRNR
jgi:hypothetical protein